MSLRCWTQCTGLGRLPAAAPPTAALLSTSRSLKGFSLRWRWWVNTVSEEARAGRGRTGRQTDSCMEKVRGMDFLVSCLCWGAGETRETGGKHVFVFATPATPISGRDRKEKQDMSLKRRLAVQILSSGSIQNKFSQDNDQTAGFSLSSSFVSLAPSLLLQPMCCLITVIFYFIHFTYDYYLCVHICVFVGEWGRRRESAETQRSRQRLRLLGLWEERISLSTTAHSRQLPRQVRDICHQHTHTHICGCTHKETLNVKLHTTATDIFYIQT